MLHTSVARAAAPTLFLACALTGGCRDTAADERAASADQLEAATTQMRSALAASGTPTERAAAIRQAAGTFAEGRGWGTNQQAAVAAVQASLLMQSAMLELAVATELTTASSVEASGASVLAALAGDLRIAAQNGAAIDFSSTASGLRQLGDSEASRSLRTTETGQVHADQADAAATAAEGFRAQALDLDAQAGAVHASLGELDSSEAMLQIAHFSELRDSWSENHRRLGHALADLSAWRGAQEIAQADATGSNRVSEAARRAEQSLDALQAQLRDNGTASAQAADEFVTAVRALVEAIASTESGAASAALDRAQEDFEGATQAAQRASSSQDQDARQSAQLAQAAAQASLARAWQCRARLSLEQAELHGALQSNPAFAGGNHDQSAAEALARATEARTKATEAVQLALDTVAGAGQARHAVALQASLTQTLEELKQPLSARKPQRAASASVAVSATGSSSDDSTEEIDAGWTPSSGGMGSPSDIAAFISAFDPTADGQFKTMLGLIGARESSAADTAKLVRDLGLAMEPLARAMAARFGDSGGMESSIVPANAKATVSEEDGSSALLLVTGEGADSKDLPLFASDGKWFIDIGGVVDEAAQQQLGRMGAIMKMAKPEMSAAAEATAKRIEAGEFATAAEAQQAFAGAIQQAMMQKMGVAPPSRR